MADSSPDTPFADMVERIRKNPEEFRGGYVVVGPDGVVITNSFFGPADKTNVAVFWGMAKNHIGLEADAAALAADRNNMTNQTYGRR